MGACKPHQEEHEVGKARRDQKWRRSWVGGMDDGGSEGENRVAEEAGSRRQRRGRGEGGWNDEKNGY